MRDETKMKLGAALSAFHESDMYSEDADSACAVIHNLLTVAKAEALIAAEDAPRFGIFHLLGHTSYTGEVVGRPHAGAYTVRYTALGGPRASEIVTGTITTEAVGRHSIEWMTEEQHAAFVAGLHREVEREAERERRTTTVPDGYQIVDREEWPRHGFVPPGADEPEGWWDYAMERCEAAWQHSEGVAKLAAKPIPF